MKCQSIWKFFCPTTLCSLFYGYVEECCVITPWTKASERYISFFNQEGGIGIFGFGVLAIFSSVFRFCCSFRFADFTQFSIWFTWPDPWSSLWSDPIRSDPNFCRRRRGAFLLLCRQCWRTNVPNSGMCLFWSHLTVCCNDDRTKPVLRKCFLHLSHFFFFQVICT